MRKVGVALISAATSGGPACEIFRLAGAALGAIGATMLLYVVSYLGLGVPAVLAGLGVVHGGGLIDTARYYGAAVIALAALALFGLLKTRPGRAAESAAPAQGIR